MSEEDESTRSSSTTTTITDPYEILHITPNPDGSITRFFQLPTSSPNPDPSDSAPVLSKDLTVNLSNNTWARLYLPRHALSSSSKLPLILCFHGGGFILFSAATTFLHDFCVDLAADLPVVVVSVEYRLAPEHRLPAAYEDALDALFWVKSVPDEWLTQYVNFSKCFLMGGSAGANIAYHAGLRVACGATDELEPLKIQGIILHQPFFGGTKRTQKELELVNDKILPLSAADLMWELALPVGVDRDHEYCNPRVERGSKGLEKMRLMGWRVLVLGCEGDPLYERQMEFVRMLEEEGLKVESWFSEGGYHAAEFVEPSIAKPMRLAHKKFIHTL